MRQITTKSMACLTAIVWMLAGCGRAMQPAAQASQQLAAAINDATCIANEPLVAAGVQRPPVSPQGVVQTTSATVVRGGQWVSSRQQLLR